jgi:hypothetical protein
VLGQIERLFVPADQRQLDLGSVDRDLDLVEAALAAQPQDRPDVPRHDGPTLRSRMNRSE